MTNKFNFQDGNNNTNVQIDVFKDDLGAINKIYKNILNNNKRFVVLKKDLSHKKLNEKIHLNLTKDSEIEELYSLCEDIYDKIILIQETFEKLEIDEQKEITIDIKERYNKEMRDNSNNLLIVLRKLFEHYTPESKLKNCEWSNIARAFVLFFLDDCTIGKKK